MNQTEFTTGEAWSQGFDFTLPVGDSNLYNISIKGEDETNSVVFEIKA